MEEKLRAIPSLDNLRAYMERLRRTHTTGLMTKTTPNGRRKFRIWFDTHIEQFDVLFQTPKERVVELVDGGPNLPAKLQEPALPDLT
jgi:N-acetylated-alpha-linked acidic dipeptidase